MLLDPTSQDSIKTRNSGGPVRVPQKKSSGTSPNIKKSSSTNGFFDDLSLMFGGNLFLKFCFLFCSIWYLLSYFSSKSFFL